MCAALHHVNAMHFEYIDDNNILYESSIEMLKPRRSILLPGKAVPLPYLESWTHLNMCCALEMSAGHADGIVKLGRHSDDVTSITWASGRSLKQVQAPRHRPRICRGAHAALTEQQFVSCTSTFVLAERRYVSSRCC